MVDGAMYVDAEKCTVDEEGVGGGNTTTYRNYYNIKDVYVGQSAGEGGPY
jgi:hypothetical protein